MISIHAAREGGDDPRLIAVGRVFISIHAAREGGDGIFTRLPTTQTDFNPRRP